MQLVDLNSLPSKQRTKYLIQIIQFMKKYPEEFHLKDIDSIKLMLINLLTQNTYLLLDNNGKLIGFVNFGYNTKNFSHLNYLRAIGIMDDYKGKGIGKFLVEQFTEIIPKPFWIMVSEKNVVMKKILDDLDFKPFLNSNRYIAYLKES